MSGDKPCGLSVLLLPDIILPDITIPGEGVQAA
jgi:hypothetical protein